MSNAVVLGNTAIETTDQTSFADGFQSGYVHFNLTHRGKPLTEEQLYVFLAETIYNPSAPSCAYCAGQVVGWITSLLEQWPRPGSEHQFSFCALVPEGRCANG
ncbi:MAG TPA: hypothetical protein VKV37_15205 [Ktedonobacteraceae bacterium]|jgi:hypothetical protein|nr:hypothetical protein [Ktedonobacteraceae bacterium]